MQTSAKPFHVYSRPNAVNLLRPVRLIEAHGGLHLNQDDSSRTAAGADQRPASMLFNSLSYLILLPAVRHMLHTVMITAVVMINVLANLLLIPLLEDCGAAIATALAFVLSVPILVAFVRLTIGVRI